MVSFFSLAMLSLSADVAPKSVKLMTLGLIVNQTREVLFNQNNISLFFPNLNSVSIDAVYRSAGRSFLAGNINETNARFGFHFGKNVFKLRIRPASDGALSFFMMDNFVCPHIVIRPFSREILAKKSSFCSLNIYNDGETYLFSDAIGGNPVFFGKHNSTKQMKKQSDSSFFMNISSTDESYFLTLQQKEPIQTEPYEETTTIIPDSYYDVHQASLKKKPMLENANANKWKIAMDLLKQKNSKEIGGNDAAVQLISKHVWLLVVVVIVVFIVIGALIYYKYGLEEFNYVDMDHQDTIQDYTDRS